VSELSAAIGLTLGREFKDVLVSGEISGVRPAASGHIYFTLKDAGSQIKCACFKSNLRFLKFKPADGLAVIARGRVDVYAPRGEYNFIVESMEPQGYGALQLAFEQLKKRLEQEGLFAEARKRAIPKMPKNIGIVTSPTGAVVQDVIQIIRRRFKGVHLRVYPAQVQGQGSVEQVVAGVNYFSASKWADVVIVCRGGGSLEDLWTFNEEAVARSIANCKVPIISAIGHETDFTIADFVADLRAPTPSAAAEIVTAESGELSRELKSTMSRIQRAMEWSLAKAAQRLDELGARGETLIRRKESLRWKQWQTLNAKLGGLDPSLRLSMFNRRLVMAATALRQSATGLTLRRRRKLEPLVASLTQMSPLRVLERGYAIVEAENGRVLVSSEEVAMGDELKVRLSKGRLKARVTEK
jgi:exodeoxyribonuclease VII large subunit